MSNATLRTAQIVCLPTLVFFLAVVPFAAGADIDETFQLLAAGEKLVDSEAATLEELLTREPRNRDARIKLLSYWATQPESADDDTVRAARARHILWIIEHSPKDDLFRTASRVAWIYVGGRWADTSAFEAGRKLWLHQVERDPKDRELVMTAASWLSLGAPEEAERLYRELGNMWSVGRLYGRWLLGLVAEDHKTGDPVLADTSRRNSAFAQKARRELDTSDDPELVRGAVVALADGAVLYADGRSDWDYTPLLRPLLMRARAANPLDLQLFTITAELPARGQRPPKVIRIGGKVMSDKLQHMVRPTYPWEAKLKRIEGTVRIAALVGLAGDIVHALVVSGPPELQSPALEAVKQWRYSQTLLNGRPVFVITTIDVNYELR